ncbi:hypothetical protein [Maribacter halichondriae]|uniref:hypothetical protein n=1 Tax=Maribacter halichondriae TaxID=2980554 RepID=UPI0023588133|nr:hypothetical protein [Maribacter sp. Hal144]
MKKLVALSLVIPFFAILFLSCQESERKGLSLNPLFSDHMVLQQQEKVAFWGTGNPNENITVSGSWGKETTTTSDTEGNWNVRLQTPEAGGPFEVTIGTANESKVLKDVLVGEVWLASGQSNMEMPLEGFLPNEPVNNYKQEVASANHPNIRYFDVTRAIAPSPKKKPPDNGTLPHPKPQVSSVPQLIFLPEKYIKNWAFR